ncbi:hypothetical protein Emed_006679 [Eimeria media]
MHAEAKRKQRRQQEHLQHEPQEQSLCLLEKVNPEELADNSCAVEARSTLLSVAKNLDDFALVAHDAASSLALIESWELGCTSAAARSNISSQVSCPLATVHMLRSSTPAVAVIGSELKRAANASAALALATATLKAAKTPAGTLASA